MEAYMNNLFNPDNKVMIAIGHVADYMLLSALWLICSIPIFTIGASTTALYYASLKILSGEETYVTKDFFRSFKQNFKQATLLWLTFLVVGILCALDLIFYNQIDSTFGTVGFVVFLSITIMYVATLTYLFPYLCKFYCTFKQAIRSSLLLSIRHLGWTIVMVIADVVAVVAALYFTFLILFLPAIICFLNSLVFKHIFKRYISEITEENSDTFATIDEIEERDSQLETENATEAAAADETSDDETSGDDETSDEITDDDLASDGVIVDKVTGEKRYF